MCGIAGFIGNQDLDQLEILNKMASSLHHRGPDDKGVWYNEKHRVGFAHARLSILDLSINGHQPMKSKSGRFVIAFNGEIYNHRLIRSELNKIHPSLRWRGNSDTETLLMAFDEWGMENTIKKCIGMFSFAVWDIKDRVLYLARDRIGEKPMYYGWQNDTLLFGSELKALRCHESFRGEINRNALSLYLRYNYIPSPYSIYKGIKKLTPGTYLKLKLDKNLKNKGDFPEPVKYWSMKETVQNGISNPFYGHDLDAIVALDELLKNSVEQQMISDVPLGAFLSGGVDSSMIVAMMQNISNRPVNTFSIGFYDNNYDEAKYAKAVAAYLGTNHTELYMTSEDIRNVIPQLPQIYDEPFADSSQLPTFLISELTRRHVTVSLSGDAGDEMFCGYSRYNWVGNIQKNSKYMPKGFLTFLSKAITTFSPQKLDNISEYIFRYLPENKKIKRIGQKAYKLADILKADNPEEIYINLMSNWKQPSNIVIGAEEPLTILNERAGWPSFNDFEHQMMYIDIMSYLPDDLLVKVDRAAMAVSLETRVPFLDHKVIEFAWKLPLNLKIRDGQSKWLLKQVLYNYVPKKLIDRPKMGFGVPIDSWLRGPLKEWAETLLDESRLNQERFFNPGPIRKKWSEHLSGKRNWHHHIWAILMFQQWYESEKIIDN